jgi:uncharacterized protein DUF5984
MLFNFTLVPLHEIKPWGEPGHESLHWFGLTDSQYWIEVGATRLLEYSEGARRAGAGQFCDYQAVRLYEDIVDLAPYVLEPIPSDLAPLIADGAQRRTLGRISAWCDAHSELVDDRYWSVVDHGSTWIGKRQLDTAYLTPSADILMWSDESLVHIEWDNQNKFFGCTGAWTARFGKYSLSRQDFIAECHSFHERLMHAMSERIKHVAAGALLRAIQVDIEGLVREHEQRRHLSPFNFGALPSPTDWAAVREVMKMIGA